MMWAYLFDKLYRYRPVLVEMMKLTETYRFNNWKEMFKSILQCSFSRCVLSSGAMPVLLHGPHLFLLMWMFDQDNLYIGVLCTFVYTTCVVSYHIAFDRIS